ncbi:MAG TPA: hypothetical protein VGH28_14570 [Polyangiaceae bacterium]|jgi:hypothetical protein
MKRSRAEGSKLFKVLVLGGLSMAVPACSSGTTGGGDAGTSDAATANDAAKDQAAPQDAAPQQDAGVVDTGCPPDQKIQCPDCTHGLCGW